LHATHSTPNANNSAAAAVKKKKKNHNRTLDYNRTERWLCSHVEDVEAQGPDAACASVPSATGLVITLVTSHKPS